MNKKLKVGLNGLGRIGRHLFKMFIDDPYIELVGINEINPDLKNWVYTINYDSIYGQYKHKAEITDKKIICNKQYINTSINNDISLVPWEEWGAEVIVDSSGLLENITKSIKFVIENDYFNGSVLSIDGGLSF